MAVPLGTSVTSAVLGVVGSEAGRETFGGLLFGISVTRSSKDVLGANAGGSGQSFGLWSGATVKTYTTKFIEPIGAAYDPGQKGI